MYTYIIIDDEPLIRRGTIKKLENYPDVSCVGQASNGQSALELIRETDPDFIITDMKMPVMDGSGLLSVLSSMYPDKYIIVISGYKDFNYAQQALRANTIDYIVKPFSRETLWDAVTNVISQLEHRNSLNDKLAMSESEKEALRYEYDKQLLRNLLFGNGREIPSGISDRLKKLLEECHYVLITINLEEPLNEGALSVFLHTRDMEASSMLITRENTDNMGFLLYFLSRNDPSQISASVMQVKELLDLFFASCSAHPFYGISGAHTSLSTLHEAFLETADALNQMTSLPSENYIFYDPDQKKNFLPEWPKLENFLFFVESGRTREAMTLFPELFHYFARDKTCRLKDAKDYCLEITDLLKKSLPKDMPLHRDAAANLNLLNNLNFVFSFQKLEEYFMQLFRNMSMAFESAGFYTENDVISNIKTYIDHHYEKDLTLEFVSSLFHLNRSYLSSAFKAHTGTSFVDYVNYVRISHAKELLENTDKKMYQIAQAVGYENAKYFFRIFKKIEGVTPEQFRTQHNAEKINGEWG